MLKAIMGLYPFGLPVVRQLQTFMQVGKCTDFMMCIADGTCFIELTYNERGGYDEMSTFELRAAAFNLITFCVNSGHAGGIVTELGLSPCQPRSVSSSRLTIMQAQIKTYN